MAVAKADNRAADGASDAAEDKRTAERQIQPINRRLGHAEDPRGYRRARQHFLPRIAGAQENPQRGANLPHHRRQQHRHHRIMAKHGKVVNH